MLQGSKPGFIFIQRFFFQSRQQVFPYKVHDRTHICGTGCDGQYSILCRKYDTVLSKRTITTVETIPAHPELVAVSLFPITFGITSIGDLLFCCIFYPCRWKELLSVPLALL